MKYQNKIWQLTALFFLSIALVVACGPAVPSDTAEPTTGAMAASSDNPAEPAANNIPATAVVARAVETDAKGIVVGFTEDGRPYRGNPEAAVVIEEFSDFQCPFCGRFASQTLSVLDSNQIANGEAVLIYYDFPLTNIHPQAVAASNAARCAGEQGAAAYWAMHDLLFANGEQWKNRNANVIFSGYGRDLGLEMDGFSGCLESNKYAAQIEADLDYGRSRGVRSTPSFFINEQPLVGAQPIEVFNSAIAAAQTGEPIAANEPSPPPAEPEAPSGASLVAPVVAPTPVTISGENVAATLGDPDAPVTIVEYSDYQCPFCHRHYSETMPSIISEMVETGRVYYVFKDFPLDSLHPEARAAAAAARCAGEQEAYWEMHDALFEAQNQWAGQGAGAIDIFTNLALNLDLDTAAFDECLAGGRYDAVVQANLDEGAALGVTATPYFFIDGFPIRGAQPFDLFEFAVGRAEEGTLADLYVPELPDVPVEESFSIGDPAAPVVIVEYTDYQCPYCRRHFQQTFWLIKENFVDTGLVRYVFKDFPLTNIHPQAVIAAEAARCAGDQGAYLEMHNVLFENLEEWNGRGNAADIFTGYAGQLNLDTDAFAGCLTSHKQEAAVMADQEEGVGLGVRGTPAFFINGHSLSGAQPYTTFEEAINALLSDMEETGY